MGRSGSNQLPPRTVQSQSRRAILSQGLKREFLASPSVKRVIIELAGLLQLPINNHRKFHRLGLAHAWVGFTFPAYDRFIHHAKGHGVRDPARLTSRKV